MKMPKNKSAYTRYCLIDKMLRKGSKLSKHQIIDRLESNNVYISLSQIRYDLEDMSMDFGAPIETIKVPNTTDKRGAYKTLYFYGDLEYSLDFRYLLNKIKRMGN